MLRRLLRRLALIALGLVFSLVVMEVVLQAGAALMPGSRADVGGARRDGARILCLGDSNTYGLYVTREQSYPARLQQMIAADPTLGAVEIMNAGVPGTNSSKLLSQFVRLLEQTHPTLVLIMIGVNDGWTLPAPPQHQRREEASALQWLWAHSRVFRFGYILRRAYLNRAEVTVDFKPQAKDGEKGSVHVGLETIDLGFTGQATVDDWRDRLIENLRSIVRIAESAGVRVVLLTYASEQGIYRPTDASIRRAAGVSGAPYIDLAPVFRPLCQRIPCPRYFLADNHPTAEGYEVVARTVLDALRARDLLHAPRLTPATHTSTPSTTPTPRHTATPTPLDGIASPTPRFKLAAHGSREPHQDAADRRGPIPFAAPARYEEMLLISIDGGNLERDASVDGSGLPGAL